MHNPYDRNNFGNQSKNLKSCECRLITSPPFPLACENKYWKPKPKQVEYKLDYLVKSNCCCYLHPMLAIYECHEVGYNINGKVTI